MTVIKISKSLFTDLYKILFESDNQQDKLTKDVKVSVNSILEYKLFKGKVLTNDEFDNLLKQSYFDTLYDYILRSLARQERTTKDITDKLKIKAYKINVPATYTETVIKKVLKLLKQGNFVNDLEYAKKYVDSRLNSSKPISRLEIINKLRLKGISNDEIALILSKYDNIDENSILVVAKSKYKKLVGRNFDEIVIKQKLYSFLSQKGYRLTTSIDQLMSNIKNENDE